MSEYKKTTVCHKCKEPYIKDCLLCKCDDMENHSFRFRQKKNDPVLDLLLSEIGKHVDEQLETLRVINEGLRQDKADVQRNMTGWSDKWEEFLTMPRKIARDRLYKINIRMEEQLDQIAAEG